MRYIKNINIQKLLKNFSKSRRGIEISLLCLVLVLVALPYIAKGYQGFLDWRENEKNWIERQKINAQEKLIYDENTRRETLLAKYAVTLNEVPNAMYSYLIGELKDKKFGSNEQCKKSQNLNKYIKYCPDRYLGICPFDYDHEKYLPSSLQTPSSQPTPTPSPLDLLIKDLRKKGYDGFTDMLVSYGEGLGGYYNMDSSCDRLNFEKHFVELEKEMSNIERMISENKDDSMVKDFNTRFYKNYLLLKNELENLSK